MDGEPSMKHTPGSLLSLRIRSSVCHQQPRETQKSYGRYTKKKTSWGRGLSLIWQVAAAGRRTSSSTICTLHGGQVQQQARCKQLAHGTMSSSNAEKKYHGD